MEEMTKANFVDLDCGEDPEESWSEQRNLHWFGQWNTTKEGRFDHWFYKDGHGVAPKVKSRQLITPVNMSGRPVSDHKMVVVEVL